MPDAATSREDVKLMTPREAVETMIPVARAIHHAHQLRILHGDVNPANILINNTDHHNIPIVTDVGLAKEIGSDGGTGSDQADPTTSPARCRHLTSRKASGEGNISTAVGRVQGSDQIAAFLCSKGIGLWSRPSRRTNLIPNLIRSFRTRQNVEERQRAKKRSFGVFSCIYGPRKSEHFVVNYAPK